MLTIGSVFALVGELANRAPKAAAGLGLALLVPGVLGVAADQLEVGPDWVVGTAGAYGSWILSVIGFTWVMLGLFGGLAGRDAPGREGTV